MDCRYCGSDEVDYLGVDDGGGDYGDSVCDQYECLECGAMFEANCMRGVGAITDDYDELEGDNVVHFPSDDVSDIPF